MLLFQTLFAGLVYPGFLFLATLGLLIEGLRRKFASRVEGRISGSILQPFYELGRILRRAVVVPAGLLPAPDDQKANKLASVRREGTRLGLYAIPLLGLLALCCGVVLLPLPGNVWPFQATAQPSGADLFGASLLFLVPTFGAVLMGSMGGSIYGQVAGSRIFQLLVVCGLPYAVALFGPAIARGSFDLRTIALTNSLPMLAIKVLCGLLLLICLPVILRLRPLAASSGEVLEGLTTDLGGLPLAFFWLMGWAERVAFAMLFSVLFVPLSFSNLIVFGAAVLLILGIVNTIDVLFSYVRLRDALNFYLRNANPAALILFLIVSFGVKI